MRSIVAYSHYSVTLRSPPQCACCLVGPAGVAKRRAVGSGRQRPMESRGGYDVTVDRWRKSRTGTLDK